MKHWRSYLLNWIEYTKSIQNTCIEQNVTSAEDIQKDKHASSHTFWNPFERPGPLAMSSPGCVLFDKADVRPSHQSFLPIRSFRCSVAELTGEIPAAEIRGRGECNSGHKLQQSDLIVLIWELYLLLLLDCVCTLEFPVSCTLRAGTKIFSTFNSTLIPVNCKIRTWIKFAPKH